MWNWCPSVSHAHAFIHVEKNLYVRTYKFFGVGERGRGKERVEGSIKKILSAMHPTSFAFSVHAVTTTIANSSR